MASSLLTASSAMSQDCCNFNRDSLKWYSIPIGNAYIRKADFNFRVYGILTLPHTWHSRVTLRTKRLHQWLAMQSALGNGSTKGIAFWEWFDQGQVGAKPEGYGEGLYGITTDDPVWTTISSNAIVSSEWLANRAEDALFRLVPVCYLCFAV